MVTPTDAAARAAATYNATADVYDHPVNSFWDRFGRRTVDRLDLQPGQRILDVCCGSGASANLAAVRAIDLREVEANVVYAVATKES